MIKIHLLRKEARTMKHIVTLNEMINISNKLIEISSQFNNLNSLITSDLCEQYYTNINKKKLQKLFSKFISARYVYEFPIDEAIQITSNYKYNGRCSNSNNTSKVENAIETMVDKQLRITEIYDRLLVVSSKLILDEVHYMIGAFINHKPEESIAESLHMSKTYLQKIKKSCVIKMWIDLKAYCDEND